MRYLSILLIISLNVFRGVGQDSSNVPEKLSTFKFGVGAGFSPASIESRALFGADIDQIGSILLPASMLFQLDFSESFRLEPEIAYMSQSLGNSSLDASKRSTWKIGLGALIKRRVSSELVAYYGARFGYLTLEESMSISSVSRSMSRPIVTLAGCFGAEYFIGRQLSIGAELQMVYVNLGAATYTPPSSGSASSSLTGMSTNALLTARLYLSK